MEDIRKCSNFPKLGVRVGYRGRLWSSLERLVKSPMVGTSCPCPLETVCRSKRGWVSGALWGPEGCSMSFSPGESLTLPSQEEDMEGLTEAFGYCLEGPPAWAWWLEVWWDQSHQWGQNWWPASSIGQRDNSQHLQG